jgi:hypothetical protein
MKSVLRRFGQVVFAYFAAVIVSALYYSIILDIGNFVKNPDTLMKPLVDLPMYFVITATFIAVLAFPGWLVILGLTRGPQKNSVSFYLKAGAINASLVPAFIFLALLRRGDLSVKTASEGIMALFWTLAVPAGGVLAGWIYWRLVEGKSTQGQVR